jgi:ABC-type sugar transport system permease subunit
MGYASMVAVVLFVLALVLVAVEYAVASGRLWPTRRRPA